MISLGNCLCNIKYYVGSFGKMSLAESVYSSFKQRTSVFFKSINLNPLNRS